MMIVRGHSIAGRDYILTRVKMMIGFPPAGHGERNPDRPDRCASVLRLDEDVQWAPKLGPIA